jgi:antitoxin component of RelBE/YafQ-DinJ toxin-antitoxin module
VGFENILEADIRKQTSERIQAYNSTKGELAAYGIDFSQIVAKYAADNGIPVGQVTERDQNELLSQTLENQVRPMVGHGRNALYDRNEVEEMIPFFTYDGDSKAVRETMKRKYFNLALEGKTKYGDNQTDFRASQDNQRKWWNNNSPEFRRKFDIDSRESQQQAKAIRKRHTQGF